MLTESTVFRPSSVLFFNCLAGLAFSDITSSRLFYSVIGFLLLVGNRLQILNLAGNLIVVQGGFAALSNISHSIFTSCFVEQMLQQLTFSDA